ncbi:unnamed protein product [Lactuca saligna]|uniref:Uncharacterized protein n=1 Tax=Lactuca saligna TaxID=75948 RepID=A0AA35UY65_LACSI|nr:unnamed protein product [Lactuca saligna]
MRRRGVLVKAQQEEAELLAQKLAERLRESEQRRKFYLEQIRERASMDFRDQTLPLLRRFLNKEEGGEGAVVAGGNVAVQQLLKRRIKKLRQRLMALKYELSEVFIGGESRVAVGTARAKIGWWLQELQRHRQARKEGAASIGLVTTDIIKFLEGKEPELHASRHLLILLLQLYQHQTHPNRKPANYFLAENLLPPMIPMLAAALENFIKITASSSSNTAASKILIENSDAITEVLDCGGGNRSFRFR